jgi:PAS domain S-box-containing protein
MDKHSGWHRAARALTAEGFALLHASPKATAIVSFHDGRFLDANSAFVDMSGFERSELLNHDMLDLGFFFDAGQRNVILRELEDCGDVRARRTRLRRSEGDLLDVLYTARLLAVGGRPAVLVQIRDLTDDSGSLIRLTLSELDDEAVLTGETSSAGSLGSRD